MRRGPRTGAPGRTGATPLSRVASRRCSRPGCPTPATVTLLMQYSEQTAALVELVEDGGPEVYDLCNDHASRTKPPVGWELDDQRPDDIVPAAARPGADELGSPETIAKLREVLHPAEPEPAVAAEPAVEPEQAEEPAAGDDGVDLFATPDDSDLYAGEPTVQLEIPPSAQGWTVPGAERTS